MFFWRRYIEIIKKIIVIILVVVITIPNMDYKVVRGDEIDNDNIHKVTFYSEDGGIEETSDYDIVDGNKVIIDIHDGESLGTSHAYMVDREGYKLVGWRLQGTNEVYYDYYDSEQFENYEFDSLKCVGDIRQYKPNNNVTFIPVWKEACTITFYSEEGFINEEDNKEFSYTVAKGIAIGNDNYPNMNGREGYECVGWKNEKTGDVYYTDYAYRSIGIDYIYNYIPEKDTKFIAIWKKCCNVTFYSDNGVDVEWIWTEDGDDYNIIYEKTYKL